MSFDIYLQRFVGGESADVARGPVLAVLNGASHSDLRSEGWCDVKFPDGTSIEFSARGLVAGGKFQGCAVHARGMSIRIATFIFEIAKAGDMVVLAAMEDGPAILTGPEQEKELPADLTASFGKVVWCKSGAEMEVLLSGGYAAWRKYADQIVK
jgi:hypothetical protein